MSSSYASGKHALGLCDRCGRQFKLNDLKMEVQDLEPTNMLMCAVCWDPDHPQYWIGRFPIDDPQALMNPRPDPDNDRTLQQLLLETGDALVQESGDALILDQYE